MVETLGLTFCNLPEHLEAKASLCRVKKTRGEPVRWGITDLVPGISENELRTIIDWALSMWGTVADVPHEEVQSAANADILIGSRRIDGPSGILAEAELPCQATRQTTRVWFDTGDSWITGFEPAERRILLAVVALHELGHSLGLGHAPNSFVDVMNATYNPAQRAPGPWSTPQMVERYGLPIALPPPPPPDGGWRSLAIMLQGWPDVFAIPGFEVRRIVQPAPTPTPLAPPVFGGSMGFAEIVKAIAWLLQQPWFIEILRRFTERQALVGDEAAMLAAFKEVVNSQ